MMDQQHGLPLGPAADRETAQAGGIGSRAHIHETLTRARGAIEAAGERVASSRSTAARSSTPVDGATSVGHASNALPVELRASVTAYVRHLRDDGVPPQRMLVLVKAAVRESAPPELDALEARALLEDVVRWSVDAYYDAA